MTRVERASHRGVEGLAIEDDHLQCVILPSIGGKMTSLRLKESGHEFMWQDPEGPVKLPSYGAFLPDYDIGGFQECFPTINEVFYPEHPWRGVVVPDHGEVWALPWNYERVEDGLHLWVHSVRFAYRLNKWVTMRAGGRLDLRYELTSLAPFNFRCLWSAHPALALRPGMMMMLPEGTRVRTEFSEHGRLGEMGQLHDWPVTRDAEGQQVDLSIIQGIEACTHDKLNTVGLTEGWCGAHDPQTGEYLAYTFSLKEIPYVGVWLIQGGWAPEGQPYLVGGFEPCTGYPGPLDSAMAWGACMTLPGRGKLGWSLEIHLGCENDQAVLISMLSEAADARAIRPR